MEALKLFALGTIGGVALAAAIGVARWLGRMGISDGTLTAGGLVLLGVGILGGSLYPISLKADARAHVEKLDITVRNLGLRMPCAGTADTGFIVLYRKLGETVDREGRVCRGLTGGAWVWHPDTNNMSQGETLS